jgi:hypothetical protein
VYSVEMLRARPDLEITLFDTEPTLAVTREYVAAAGLESRIHLRSGDYQQGDFGNGEFDLVLLANVLQKHPPEQSRSLLQKTFNALVSEGRSVVNEFLLRDDRTGPVYPALHALHLLLTSVSGRGYTAWDVTDLMQSVGFIRLQIIPLEPAANSLVVGLHP